MQIAIKNNAILAPNGQVAENCQCCDVCCGNLSQYNDAVKNVEVTIEASDYIVKKETQCDPNLRDFFGRPLRSSLRQLCFLGSALNGTFSLNKTFTVAQSTWRHTFGWDNQSWIQVRFFCRANPSDTAPVVEVRSFTTASVHFAFSDTLPPSSSLCPSSTSLGIGFESYIGIAQQYGILCNEINTQEYPLVASSRFPLSLISQPQQLTIEYPECEGFDPGVGVVSRTTTTSGAINFKITGLKVFF